MSGTNPHKTLKNLCRNKGRTVIFTEKEEGKGAHYLLTLSNKQKKGKRERIKIRREGPRRTKVRANRTTPGLKKGLG